MAYVEPPCCARCALLGSRCEVGVPGRYPTSRRTTIWDDLLWKICKEVKPTWDGTSNGTVRRALVTAPFEPLSKLSSSLTYAKRLLCCAKLLFKSIRLILLVLFIAPLLG